MATGLRLHITEKPSLWFWSFKKKPEKACLSPENEKLAPAT